MSEVSHTVVLPLLDATLSTPFPKYGDVFCADSGRYDQRILVEEDVACRGGALL
jgi:hypothetical protein